LSLHLFLVVIVSLACGTLPPLDVAPMRPILASAMLVTSWSLLCHIGVRLIAKQAVAGELDPMQAVDWMEKQLSMFRWLGLPVIVLCLGGFGMGRVMDQIPVVADSMAVRSVLLLLPGLLLTAATWSAENYYGILVGYTTPGWRSHLRSTGQVVRAGIAWLILPVVMLMLVSDLVTYFAVDEDVAGWLLPVVMLVAVPLGLPRLIRFLLKTEPVSGRQADWIDGLLRAVGVGRTTVVRWNTGGTTFNAMVAGFVAPMRTLLISDRLLDELPEDQIAMVVLHEAAHTRRRHVPLRMLSILPAWASGVLVTRLAGQSDYAMAMGTVAGILLTILILRIVSYRTEFDADLQACRMAASLAGRIAQVPPSESAAAVSLGRALRRVTMDHPAGRKPTWLHPGLETRLELLRNRTSPPSNSSVAGTIANPAYR